MTEHQVPLRLALRGLIGRLGQVAPPSAREVRTLDALVRAQRDDLGAVVELIGFVEAGLELGTFRLGALRWVAARVLEVLEPVGWGPDFLH